jgi:hypothetical protein
MKFNVGDRVKYIMVSNVKYGSLATVTRVSGNLTVRFDKPFFNGLSGDPRSWILNPKKFIKLGISPSRYVMKHKMNKYV